jgi:hypothetical protein
VVVVVVVVVLEEEEEEEEVLQAKLHIRLLRMNSLRLLLALAAVAEQRMAEPLVDFLIFVKYLMRMEQQ